MNSEFGPYRSDERMSREILPFLTDYASDELDFPGRAEYYRMLRVKFGVATLRTELRLNRMIAPSGILNEQVIANYRDSLLAMREAGFASPIIVLFSPDEWMVKEAHEFPNDFFKLYQQYTEKVLSLCQETGVTPSYIQVMNEVNWQRQNPFTLDSVVHMLQITKDVFSRPHHSATKIMTSVYTNSTDPRFLRETASGRLVQYLQIGKQFPPYNDWQGYTEELVNRAGGSLDAIGFDIFSGSWDRTVLWSDTNDVVQTKDGKPTTALLDSAAFRRFGDTTAMEWIAGQKVGGILQGLDVLITEIGAPDHPLAYQFARYGLNRIIVALDHVLLGYEQRGFRAQDIVAGIGFFQGGDHDSIVSRFPGRIDVFPWTLIRKDNAGNWALTYAGERIKHLIETRIYPSMERLSEATVSGDEDIL